MTQDPHGSDEQPTGSSLPSLPSFSSDDPRSLPDYETAEHGASTGEPGERARHRTLTTVLAVVGSGVVLLAVIALVLSQTVFRSVLEEGDPQAYKTGERSAEGQSEYVPDPQDPDIAPPPPIFTEKPTTECTMPSDNASAEPADPGTIRGGDLQYTIPESWQFAWGPSSLPYLTEVDAQARNVEGNWYSVVNLGKVTWPEDEGGYPGTENAAVALFQCYATTSGVIDYFGEEPQVTDYRSEARTIDGQSGWIVQATYHFEDPETLATTQASVVTSIVVDGPDGPSALVSDVAADQPEHVQDLEDIIASLEVVE
ncbi:hypothetical protein [Brachybacterium sacelli]|uniref:Serine/threonine protein kinase n=1 Tax=Brachybacterium sacelli TaxID=173364 RepID=A0ABS4X0B5_9MICO|nr:hypothetical protein [Brachybacterium sacelli]MBP2381900.1 hypothetical protein [Brachybacterium sacelli]